MASSDMFMLIFYMTRKQFVCIWRCLCNLWNREHHLVTHLVSFMHLVITKQCKNSINYLLVELSFIFFYPIFLLKMNYVISRQCFYIFFVSIRFMQFCLPRFVAYILVLWPPFWKYKPCIKLSNIFCIWRFRFWTRVSFELLNLIKIQM